MPLNALKASWEVHAGILPGEPLKQYSRRWEYTDEDHQDDQHPNCVNDPAHHAIFAKMRAEAMDYFLQASAPHLNNWARIEFIWY